MKKIALIVAAVALASVVFVSIERSVVHAAAPARSSISPSDNATNVSISTGLTLTFNSNVLEGTGNIEIKRFNDELVQSVPASQLTGWGTATISVALTALLPGNDYYVNYPATLFKNATNEFAVAVTNNSTWNFTTAGTPWTGGAGTVASPWQITTCAELFSIGGRTIYLDDHFSLANSLDCSSYSAHPIFHQSTYFSGTFDGQGRTISNVSMTCISITCGLFSRVSGNSIVISDVSLVNFSLTNAFSYTGALFGWCQSSVCTALVEDISVQNISIVGVSYVGSISGACDKCTLRRVTSSGAVTGSSHVGGIAGRLGVALETVAILDVATSTATVTSTGDGRVGGLIGSHLRSSYSITDGILKDSQFSGTVVTTGTGTSQGMRAGGLIGESDYIAVQDSSVSGSVTAREWVGGLVGDADYSRIARSSSSGPVSQTKYETCGGSVGGLVGTSYDIAVTESYSSSRVEGFCRMGGLIGVASNGAITNSYFVGSLNQKGTAQFAGLSVGGLVGLTNSSTVYHITNSYSAYTKTSEATMTFRGLVGEKQSGTSGPTCTQSVWDKEVSSIIADAACSSSNGLTTSAMKTTSTFSARSWDFDTVWGVDSSLNSGYPILRAFITDTVAPDATSTPDLVAGSDTGSSSTDNITNDSTPTISVTAAENGGTVTVRAEKAGVFHACQMSGSTSGATCTLPSLADGVWLITTVHADAAGNTSSRSSALSITIDTAAPTLSSVSPTTDATGVLLSSSIRVTFSESIAKGSGTLSLLTASDCTASISMSMQVGSLTSSVVQAFGTAEAVPVSSSGITTSGSVVTFTPSAALATSTRHCVTYPAGAFTDTAGNNAPAMTLLSTGRVVFTTAGADVTSPSATISSPASPASSRTLVYAVVFDEVISGLTSADFSNLGTANCTFAVPTSSGTSFSITATCTSDGTVILRLAPNSVTDGALNTGPTSAVVASTVTIDTTTPTTAPSETVAPTQTIAPAQTIAPSSGTTVPSVGTGTPSGPAPVAQGVVTTVVPTTTLPAPSTTTTTLPSMEVPEVADGSGALVVDGERIEATITRENNQLVIAAGILRARISAVQREGGRAPLDSLGRIRMDRGDSIEIEVTGFGAQSQVEVRMYSDPVLLGRSTVSALGNLMASYEVPDSVDNGRHTVVLSGESQQGEKLTFALAVFVGAESTGPSALALLVGIPLGLAVIAALVIPAIIRRRRKDEEEK